MSDLFSFSSMTTMLQTSNIVWQNVNLTDEVKLNLQYDTHSGLLNIFVKNNDNEKKIPCHINIPSCQTKQEPIQLLPETQRDNNEDNLEILYELSTIYTYDINEEKDLSEIISPLSSSSTSSSCFDEQTLDNDDDGYSTHSSDDCEQHQPQLPLSVPPPKKIRQSYSRFCHTFKQFKKPIRRLIEQTIWLNVFKKPIHQTMMNHRFL